MAKVASATDESVAKVVSMAQDSVTRSRQRQTKPWPRHFTVHEAVAKSASSADEDVAKGASWSHPP